jgi:hypothetical protein
MFKLFIQNWIERWYNFLPNRRRIQFLILAFFILFATFYLNNKCSAYADKVQGATLHDLLLDHIIVRDVNFIFFWIALCWCLCMFIYHIIYPKQMANLVWTYALFIAIRAIFITLTHMGPPSNLEQIPTALKFYAFSADMFFSGHVGGPFLLALLTTNFRYRILALIYTGIMIIIVLLGHMHYSIDVFASLFIAHSIAEISKKLKHVLDPIIFKTHV